MTTVSTSINQFTVNVVESGDTSTVEIISAGPEGPQGIQGIQGPAGADAPDTLATLTDTDIDTPVSGQLLSYNGSLWVNEAPRVWVYEQPTAPTSPNEGDIWVNTVFGTNLIRTQGAWVESGTSSRSYDNWLTEYGYSVPSFSPLDLSPVLWLDASDTSTITESGGAVSQWDDKSGNANHVVQATAANQPTTGTRTMNGLNVLDFSTDLLALSGFTTTSPFTFITVFVPDVSVGTQYIIAGDGVTVVAYLGTNSAALLNAGSSVTGSTISFGDELMLWENDSTGSQIRRNGAVYATGTVGTNGMTEINIGNRDDLARSFDGVIAEIIVVDGTLTADQIADTEAYLADKWGITL